MHAWSSRLAFVTLVQGKNTTRSAGIGASTVVNNSAADGISGIGTVSLIYPVSRIAFEQWWIGCRSPSWIGNSCVMTRCHRTRETQIWCPRRHIALLQRRHPPRLLRAKRHEVAPSEIATRVRYSRSWQACGVLDGLCGKSRCVCADADSEFLCSRSIDVGGFVGVRSVS